MVTEHRYPHGAVLLCRNGVPWAGCDACTWWSRQTKGRRMVVASPEEAERRAREDASC